MSLIAVHNHMALDMLLAEEEGMIFDNMSCTLIPNNTALDGSVTRGLEGLCTFSNEIRGAFWNRQLTSKMVNMSVWKMENMVLTMFY